LAFIAFGVLLIAVCFAPFSRDDDGGVKATMAPMHTALSIPGAAHHWYGKVGVRPGRKLGHMTLVAPSVAELRVNAAPLRIAQETIESLMGAPACATAAAVSPSAPAAAAAAAANSSSGSMPTVGIIMGSDSDLPCMKAAAEVLDRFGVKYELTIVSGRQ
jgi:phosphoribosylaminoimidazole carboxylase